MVYNNYIEKYLPEAIRITGNEIRNPVYERENPYDVAKENRELEALEDAGLIFFDPVIRRAVDANRQRVARLSKKNNYFNAKDREFDFG